MSARRVLAVGLIVLMLPGCSSWRPAPGSPDPALLPAGTKQVRVQLSSGSRLVLQHPEFVADSLRGVKRGYTSQTIVPASEIVTLESSDSSGGKTAAVIVGTLAVIGIFVAIRNSWESAWDSSRSPSATVPR